MEKIEKRAKLVKYSKYGYIFTAPFIIIFLVFSLYPIIYQFYLSFTDFKTGMKDYSFIGFENYKQLWNNNLFKKSFVNTAIIWTLNFIPQLTIAMLLAAAFTNTRLRIKGTGFFKVVFYLPNILTAATIAVLYAAIFNTRGAMNQILMSMGIIKENINFFISPTKTRIIVAFIQFWMWYGNTLIIMVAGMLGINPQLYEAAMVDGATNRQMFFKITLPLLMPITLYVLVTSLVGGLTMFDIPFLLTGTGGTGHGNPDSSILTVTMFIRNRAFSTQGEIGLASAASVVLLIVITILTAIIFVSMRNRNMKGVQ